jgi:hypothetical protein
MHAEIEPETLKGRELERHNRKEKLKIFTLRRKYTSV